MNNTRKILMLVLVVTLLFFQQLKFSKSEILPLYGEFVKTPRPIFSIKTFLDGSFQKQFETWFSESQPYRNILIRTENSLNYWVFNEISPAPEGNAVILGQDNNLCEKSYINAFNGVSKIKGDRPKPSTLSIQESAEKLSLLSTIFKRLNKNFVFLFYPQKAVIYPELLKSKWKLKGGEEKSSRDFQAIKDIFKEFKIPYVDGAEIFAKLKRDYPDIPLYPKGGTHWNYFGACKVLNEILKVANHQEVRRLPALNCKVTSKHSPGVRESDIARITNLWSNSPFDEPIWDAIAEPSFPAPQPPLFLFYEGTSFAGEIYNMMRSTHIALESSPLPGSYYHPGAKSNFDWDADFIEKTDFFVLEQSQASYLTKNVTDFVEDLEKYSQRYRNELKKLKSKQITFHSPKT